MEGAQRSDGALARAARLGDAEAFAVIVHRHGPAMRRYARYLLRHDEDAADVTQDALVSAWRGLGSFRGDAALRTWLFTLVSRRAADLRRRRWDPPMDQDRLARRVPPLRDEAFGGAVDAELLAALRRSLQELTWRQRACWLLREVEGLSYDEIAAALAVTSGQVRSCLYRGRATLATRMEAWR